MFAGLSIFNLSPKHPQFDTFITTLEEGGDIPEAVNHLSQNTGQDEWLRFTNEAATLKIDLVTQKAKGDLDLRTALISAAEEAKKGFE